MVIVEPGEEARLHRGLDMGVNDYVQRPVNPSELLARVRTQVKRKRYTDYLRSRLEQTVEMAVLDPLTALYNRRYLTSHLVTLFEESAERGRPLSVLLIDVDHFKSINDTHGTTLATTCCGSWLCGYGPTFGASTLPARSGARSSWS